MGAWFENPLTALETLDTRLDSLVRLVSATLGPGTALALDQFSDAQWYPVPNPVTGGGTALHIVTPQAPAPTTGQLGVGVLYPFGVGNLTIQAYAYVPLF